MTFTFSPGVLSVVIIVMIVSFLFGLWVGSEK